MAQAFKPPATQKLYDVCIIGSQLGGAVAGALLAKRGFRVLYVDHDGTGTYYEERGYLLPHAPALIPAPRLLPAAELALTELGFTTDLGRALETSTPALQLLFPKHRVDLHAEAPPRVAELRREWPGDADALEAALVALGHGFDAATPILKAMPPLPPDGFLEGRALSKAVKFAHSSPAGAVDLRADPLRAIDGHPIGEALRAAQRFMTHLDGEPPPISTLRLAGALTRGAQRIPAAYDGMRDAIRKKIADARGELLGVDGGAPAVAERLDADGSRVTAVRLEGSPNAYVARAFVLATSPASVMRLVPEGLHRKVGDVTGLRTTRQVVSINFVVRAAAVPPGLGDTALLAGDGDGGEAVLVQVLPARRDSRKGGGGEPAPDERVLCAATWVDADAWDREGAVDAALALVRARLATILPFLQQNLVRESVPSSAATPERRGNIRAMHPLYASELEAQLGVTGIPYRALKNVVFAGREVVPGLGIEGEFHAGVQAAAAAQAILGKREFLK